MCTKSPIPRYSAGGHHTQVHYTVQRLPHQLYTCVFQDTSGLEENIARTTENLFGGAANNNLTTNNSNTNNNTSSNNLTQPPDSMDHGGYTMEGIPWRVYHGGYTMEGIVWYPC